MSLTNSKYNNTFTNPFQSAISTRFLGLFLLMMLSLFSCGKEEAIEEAVINVPFAGNWTGPVTGLPGTVTMNLLIREDGIFFMDFTPPRGAGAYSGTVTEDGILEGGLDNGAETTKFTGTLQATRGSGDWESEQNTPTGIVTDKGTWSVEKDE